MYLLAERKDKSIEALKTKRPEQKGRERKKGKIKSSNHGVIFRDEKSPKSKHTKKKVRKGSVLGCPVRKAQNRGIESYAQVSTKSQLLATSPLIKQKG